MARFGVGGGEDIEVGGVEDGEDTEFGGVKNEVGRVFGCGAGFGLSDREIIDSGGVELETAGFGFFAW